MKSALVICFLMICSAVAGSQQDGLMPVGFDQVYIGMGWQALVELRPNAEIMDMEPDPGKSLKPNIEEPKEGLVEELSAGPFDRVLYSFENGVLAALMFGKKDSSSSSIERKNLLGMVAKERGMPAQIELVGDGHDLGVLTWNDHDVQVNVIAPSNDAMSKNGVLGLQIMDRDYAERIKAIGSSNYVKKDGKLQDIDKDRIEAFRSEILFLLSIKDSAPEE